jgi:hypothetical protein
MTEPTATQPQPRGSGGLHHAVLRYDSDAEFRRSFNGVRHLPAVRRDLSDRASRFGLPTGRIADLVAAVNAAGGCRPSARCRTAARRARPTPSCRRR